MPTCAICGKNLPMIGVNKVRLKGGDYACLACVKKAGHNPMTWTKNLSTTADMLKAEINGEASSAPAQKDDIDTIKVTFDRRRTSLGLGAKARVSDTFKPDKSFDKRFFIDTVHKKRQALGPVHDYTDLVSYEYLEDGGTVVSGGIGNAIVGGALFGGVGAVVGAATGKKKQSEFVNSMKIRLTVNSMKNPTEFIDMNPVRIRMKRSSGQYRKNSDPADEILKYKRLLDAGAITQEEYEAKKSSCLGCEMTLCVHNRSVKTH